MVHHKQQLLKFLEQNIKDRVLQNVLDSGVVEFLGGFRPLLKDIPGWIVQLTSCHNTVYNIGIFEDINIGKLRWFRLTEIPWENWVGDKSENRLYQGDKPEKYLELKNDNTRI